MINVWGILPMAVLCFKCYYNPQLLVFSSCSMFRIETSLFEQPSDILVGWVTCRFLTESICVASCHHLIPTTAPPATVAIETDAPTAPRLHVTATMPHKEEDNQVENTVTVPQVSDSPSSGEY